MPRKSASTDAWLSAAVLLASFLYLCLFRRVLRTMQLDEGIVLQGAQRVLDGQVVYRDFFSFLTPGSIYFYALLFRLFGDSMLVARTALAAIGAAYAWFTFVLARRVCSRWCALLTAALVTLTCLPGRFLVIHSWDSTLWACVAIYCAVRWLESSGARAQPAWAFAAGAATSLTAIAEQSKGAGLLLGLALGFTLVAARAPAALRPRRAWRRLVLPALAGLALPSVAVLVALAHAHALGPFVADMIWPLRHYAVANRVRYGFIEWSDVQRAAMFHAGPWPLRLLFLAVALPAFVVPVLPLIAIAVGAAFLLPANDGRGLQPGLQRARCDARLVPAGVRAHYLLLASAIAGLWLSVLVTRQSSAHFIYLAPVFYLVLAWLMDGADWPGTLVRAARPLLTLAFVVVFGSTGLGYLAAARLARSPLATRRGELRGSQPNAMLPFLEAHLAPGSPLLVYPYAPLFYYLSATRSPLRFDFFQPGMYTPAQAQTAVRTLAAAPPPVVLFDPSFDEAVAFVWPNTPPQALASDPLASFLFAHYRFCRALSGGGNAPYFYLARRDLPCPQ